MTRSSTPSATASTPSTAATGTDTLFVSGTAGNDTIHAAVNGSGVISSIEGMSPTGVELFKVDAGSGTDTLDYTGTTSAVTVNLAAGTATGFASAAGFENVTGGTGNDLAHRQCQRQHAHRRRRRRHDHRRCRRRRGAIHPR